MMTLFFSMVKLSEIGYEQMEFQKNKYSKS